MATIRRWAGWVGDLVEGMVEGLWWYLAVGGAIAVIAIGVAIGTH